MDFVEKVKLFNQIAGNNEEFNPRKFCLYVGLIYEELGELLESFNSDEWNETTEYFKLMSDRFKQGHFDSDVSSEKFNRLEALDACVDIAVVALGGGMATGADIVGGTHAVADNNLEKFPFVNGERTVLKDENGKIKKPEGYQSVKLDSYLK